MLRVVVLGTGTAIGKTHVTSLLARHVRDARHHAVVALKPVETGYLDGAPSDFAQLAAAGRPPLAGRPPFAFARGVSPHLAAREEGVELDLRRVTEWVRAEETAAASGGHAPPEASWCFVETAGAAFSPLGPGTTNHDLAVTLEPAAWLLVAPDRLGVLHDLTVTLRALCRAPDAVVLSTPIIDASTGSNAEELRTLGIADAHVIPRTSIDDSTACAAQLEAILTRLARCGS